ncbi:efflux RND transporter periplasmic adaptor subunit [Brevibacillus composti]|uniref:Efflux RND transporter periplasmic adaptor subunit n=1 Tax=Brevibacillus composti TaxID=2796470 RepID=A0A7T5ENI8_9BACL|nr:efflux RND transporter periplasmic adaptor subunit [Brevibacillus composti]QQE75822.1 efflux RND transporter periplasmic adaptor subunit [Brevibacillus composti]QUO42848.1 efflux RND transporter periplasmic adaptor subunit [Brevibacillus composti]
MTKKKKWIIIAAALVLLGGGSVFGYTKLKSGETSGEMPQDQPPPLPTVAVEMGEVSKAIFSAGTVEAKAREEVKPELSGKVEKVFVTEGQRVSKGDPLFSIDGSDAALELQKQELSIIRAEKELAEIRNKKDRITAEKGGKIKEVLIKEGDQVTPETIVAKMVNTDYLKITGKFTAYEAERFKLGQQVKVFLSASLSYIDGTITKIDLTGAKEKGVGGVHDVEVLVKKPGAIYVGDLGEVQYTDPRGILFASQIATPFENPDDIDLYAGTHGKVGKVEIENGDEIQAGQLIAKMDMSSVDLELKEKELILRESQLTMEQKRRDLAKRQVTAPISGVITKLNVTAGETPDSGKPAAIIMDTSAVYFVAAVDEMDIPSIKLGQHAEVYVTAFGNKPFEGKVVEVPKEGTKEDKTVRFAVKIELSDTSEMKHGMTGDCDIYVDKKENVLRLPLQAVEIVEEGKGTVMVKDPNTGEPMPKEVAVGIEGSEYVEIVSGLSAGEEVVLNF